MPRPIALKKVFHATEHDPADQKNDKQVAKVRDVVLYLVNASLNWRPEDPSHLVGENLRAGEMHEPIKDIGKQDCRRDQVANDAVD